MARILTPALLLMAAPALADPGLHHHPHGIDWGWALAALAGLCGGLALARWWTR